MPLNLNLLRDKPIAQIRQITITAWMGEGVSRVSVNQFILRLFSYCSTRFSPLFCPKAITPCRDDTPFDGANV